MEHMVLDVSKVQNKIKTLEVGINGCSTVSSVRLVRLVEIHK